MGRIKHSKAEKYIRDKLQFTNCLDWFKDLEADWREQVNELGLDLNQIVIKLNRLKTESPEQKIKHKHEIMERVVEREAFIQDFNLRERGPQLQHTFETTPFFKFLNADDHFDYMKILLFFIMYSDY